MGKCNFEIIINFYTYTTMSQTIDIVSDMKPPSAFEIIDLPVVDEGNMDEKVTVEVDKCNLKRKELEDEVAPSDEKEDITLTKRVKTQNEVNCEENSDARVVINDVDNADHVDSQPEEEDNVDLVSENVVAEADINSNEEPCIMNPDN